MLGILLAATVVFDGFIVAAIRRLAISWRSLVTAGNVIFVLLVEAMGLAARLELVRLWRGGRTGAIALVAIFLGLLIRRPYVCGRADVLRLRVGACQGAQAFPSRDERGGDRGLGHRRYTASVEPQAASSSPLFG
ncbi:MAG: hypothetical protein WEE67_01240 [Chloroflexota bacterium]